MDAKVTGTRQRHKNVNQIEEDPIYGSFFPVNSRRNPAKLMDQVRRERIRNSDRLDQMSLGTKNSIDETIEIISDKKAQKRTKADMNYLLRIRIKEKEKDTTFVKSISSNMDSNLNGHLPPIFNENLPKSKPEKKKIAEIPPKTGYNIGSYKSTKQAISQRNQGLLCNIDQNLDEYRLRLNKFKAQFSTGEVASRIETDDQTKKPTADQKTEENKSSSVILEVVAENEHEIDPKKPSDETPMQSQVPVETIFEKKVLIEETGEKDDKSEGKAEASADSKTLNITEMIFNPNVIHGSTAGQDQPEFDIISEAGENGDDFNQPKQELEEETPRKLEENEEIPQDNEETAKLDDNETQQKLENNSRDSFSSDFLKSGIDWGVKLVSQVSYQKDGEISLDLNLSSNLNPADQDQVSVCGDEQEASLDANENETRHDNGEIRDITLSLDSRSSKFGFDYRILQAGQRYIPRIFRVAIGLSAFEAGLRDGDFILSINGQSTSNMTLENVQEHICACSQELNLRVISKFDL